MILIAAGSSLPFCGIDSQQLVSRAFSAIGRFVTVNAVSGLFETPAWPDPSDPLFINGAIEVVTDLSPEALLAGLHAIEAGFGRKRVVKNAPRTLDLDLLVYGIVRRTTGDLILPHPRLHEREFVLAPVCDIAPDWRHMDTGQTACEMLQALADNIEDHNRQAKLLSSGNSENPEVKVLVRDFFEKPC